MINPSQSELLPEELAEENTGRVVSRVHKKPVKRNTRRKAPKRETRKKPDIPFAYYSVLTGEDILHTILEHDGIIADIDTLYDEWGGTNLNLASFRIRIGGLEKTGRITRDKNNVHLTELGRLNCSPDPQVQMHARQEAFLYMELNRRLMKKYLGEPLPSTSILNNELIALGVLDSIANRARQVFLRSAKETGFLADDTGILVLPDGISMSSLDERVRESGDDEQGEVSMVAPTPGFLPPDAPASAGSSQADMESIIDLVMGQRPSFNSLSEEEFDTWRRWLDTTFEFAKIRARRRQ